MARLSAVDGAATPAFFRIAAEVAALAATMLKAPAGAKERRLYRLTLMPRAVSEPSSSSMAHRAGPMLAMGSAGSTIIGISSAADWQIPSAPSEPEVWM